MKKLLLITPIFLIACSDQKSLSLPVPGPKTAPTTPQTQTIPVPSSVSSANGYLLFQYNEDVPSTTSNGYKLIIHGENSL